MGIEDGGPPSARRLLTCWSERGSSGDTAPRIIVSLTRSPNRCWIHGDRRGRLRRLLCGRSRLAGVRKRPVRRCDRKHLARLQLQAAVVGLAPVSAFVVAWIGGWRRVAAAMFVLAAGMYLTWAVLADAAVHGWDDLSCSRSDSGALRPPHGFWPNRPCYWQSHGRLRAEGLAFRESKRRNERRLGIITRRRILYWLAAMVAVLVVGTIIGLVWADTSDIAGLIAVVTNLVGALGIVLLLVALGVVTWRQRQAA